MGERELCDVADELERLAEHMLPGMAAEQLKLVAEMRALCGGRQWFGADFGKGDSVTMTVVYDDGKWSLVEAKPDA